MSATVQRITAIVRLRFTREEIERAIENAALSIKKKIAEETGLKIEEIKLGEET